MINYILTVGSVDRLLRPVRNWPKSWFKATDYQFPKSRGWQQVTRIAVGSTKCRHASTLQSFKRYLRWIWRQTGQRRVPDFLLVVIVCRYELLRGNGMWNPQPLFGFEAGCGVLNGAHVIGVEVGAIQFVCLRILIGVEYMSTCYVKIESYECVRICNYCVCQIDCAHHVAPFESLDSIGQLICTSYFSHHVTGEPTPDMDGFCWTSRHEFRSLCTLPMAQQLLLLDW